MMSADWLQQAIGQAQAPAPAYGYSSQANVGGLTPDALDWLMRLLGAGQDDQATPSGSPIVNVQQKLGNSTIWTRGNSAPWDYNAALGYPGIRGRANIDSPILGAYKQALMKQQARGLLDITNDEPLK